MKDMTKNTKWIYLLIVSSLAIALGAVVVPRATKAQDQGEPQAEAPPEPQGGTQAQGGPQAEAPPEPQGGAQAQGGPAVARISVAQGQVSTQHADGGDWAAATVNAPLQGGDSVSTGDRSRTEVQFDYANAMRLDQSSVVKMADLSQSRIQLQLSQGLMEYSVLGGGQAGAEIDTPNVAVQPAGEGIYRIQVDPNSQQTWVTVRKGQVQVSTPQGSQNVDAGQTMVIQGTDNPQFQVNAAAGRDEFDQWVEDRDRQVLEARSWEHTNRNYTGSGDLDRYGTWRQAPGYGDVWQPYESSDWAPYADGRWVWEPYYGWTWVSYEPWGWAPYHYGRWFMYDNNWAWWPGPVYPGYNPIWAPAYVSFFGFGRGGWGFGFGFGGGFGSIGWLPLGPYDNCYRWWGGGFHNGFNAGNFGNIYGGRGVIRPMPPLATGGRYPRISNVALANSNPRVRGGLTMASAQNFGSGRVVRQGTPMSEAAFRGATRVQGGLPVSASRASLSPSGQFTSRAALPRAANTNTSFFSRGRAGTFAGGQGGFGNRTAQQAGRGSMGAQTFGRGAAPSARAPNVGSYSRGGMTAQGRPQAASAPSQQLGWRRFGTPAPQAGRATSQSFAGASRQAAPFQRPAPNSGGGWQRFSQAPAQNRPNYSAPRSQPAPSSWGRTAPQGQPNYSAPHSQPAPSNWGRSAPTYRSAPAPSNYNRAPSNYNRAPLGSSRPIVSAPRSYNSGGGYGGGYRAAPSGGYGGGYRAAPAPPYHAAPSGGGGGRSYGGGGGGRSSGGGGGGGRSSGGGGGGGHSGGGGGGHGRH